MTKVALLDYGMGNLHSAGKALTAVGADVSITRDPAVIAAADKIVFPGVGAMRDCMAEMQAAGIADAVKTAVFSKPVMAICVGMQALFERSEENDGVACLGVLGGDVKRLTFCSSIDSSMKCSVTSKSLLTNMFWKIIDGSTVYE